MNDATKSARKIAAAIRQIEAARRLIQDAQDLLPENGQKCACSDAIVRLIRVETALPRATLSLADIDAEDRRSQEIARREATEARGAA